MIFFFSIITGRFYDTACDDNKRDLLEMQNNIIYTMYPALKQLGLPIENYNTDNHKSTIHKVCNDFPCFYQGSKLIENRDFSLMYPVFLF